MTESSERWLEISFEIDSASIEAAEMVLLNSGAHSVTLQDAADQPLLEPLPGETPLWNHSRITGLFTNTDGLEMTLELIRHAVASLKPKHWRVNRFEDQDWVRVWMDDFKPLKFGDNLWVCPSHQPIPEPSAVNLILDPGLAFGTGTHPTTALCLEWLASHDIKNTSVIDYGCGSGILAIAALLLGAQHCTAIDIDEQALYATRENAKQNSVENKLSTFSVETAPKETRDIVLANILSGTLIDLKKIISSQVKPRGQLILSGILNSQAQAVIEAYADEFAFAPPAQQGDWVLLAAQKTG